jgi:hypothetical protein
MAWFTQVQHNDGVAERHLEKLAELDKGIILYRRMLKEQMKIVEDGGEPMNVFRDSAKNESLDLNVEPSRGFGVGNAPKKYFPQEAGESKAHADVERILATYHKQEVSR